MLEIVSWTERRQFDLLYPERTLAEEPAAADALVLAEP
jgi:hypothetical protein